MYHGFFLLHYALLEESFLNHCFCHYTSGVHILLIPPRGGGRNQKVLGLGKKIKKEGREGNKFIYLFYNFFSCKGKGNKSL